MSLCILVQEPSKRWRRTSTSSALFKIIKPKQAQSSIKPRSWSNSRGLATTPSMVRATWGRRSPTIECCEELHPNGRKRICFSEQLGARTLYHPYINSRTFTHMWAYDHDFLDKTGIIYRLQQCLNSIFKAIGRGNFWHIIMSKLHAFLL